MKLDETPGYAFCRIARKVHYQIDLIFKEEGRNSRKNTPPSMKKQTMPSPLP